MLMWQQAASHFVYQLLFVRTDHILFLIELSCVVVITEPANTDAIRDIQRTYFSSFYINKKFELMLTRRAEAFSSSGSVV